MTQRLTPALTRFATETGNVPRECPGYQQTDAGIIPSDWDALPLRSLGRCLSGGTPRLADERLWGGDIPWVTSKDMKVPRLSDAIDHVTELGTSRGTRLVDPGTILIVVRGMALLHSLPVALAERPLTFNQDLKAFVPAADVNAEFILGWFQVAENRLLLLASEATHGTKRLPTADLLAAKIAVPSLDEQNAIAEALLAVDGLIGALEKLIAKKRAIKQAAMQQLLTGETRLPGFGSKWDQTTLGEVANIKSGATPSTQVAAFWNGTIPWCTPSDITATSAKYLATTERSITEAGLAACAASLLPPGALLLCSRATIGEVKIATANICTNQGFKSLICRSYVSHEFLYYLVLRLKREMVDRAVGSTFLEISRRDLESIPIRIPQQDEQMAIATVLCDMDAEIEALDRRLDKTKQIKRGMMQQLLTGRIRLVKPQQPIAQASVESKARRTHSWAFNEAVVISVLARRFGSEEYPLGRKRYTKLSYLLHRHVEKSAEGYLKKAAGPYNPKTRYGGPERIALQQGYVRQQKYGKYRGFVAADNIAKAEVHFEKWYGSECIRWLEQFRRKRNDDLELLTTVDMAAVELREAGKAVNVANVKHLIRAHAEWKAKLDRPVFSDSKIAKAITTSRELFAAVNQDDIDGGA